MKLKLFALVITALWCLPIGSAVPDYAPEQRLWVQGREYMAAVPDDSTDPFGPDDPKDIEPRPGLVPDWACWKCHVPVPKRPKKEDSDE